MSAKQNVASVMDNLQNYCPDESWCWTDRRTNEGTKTFQEVPTLTDLKQYKPATHTCICSSRKSTEPCWKVLNCKQSNIFWKNQIFSKKIKCTARKLNILMYWWNQIYRERVEKDNCSDEEGNAGQFKVKKPFLTFSCLSSQPCYNCRHRLWKELLRWTIKEKAKVSSCQFWGILATIAATLSFLKETWDLCTIPTSKWTDQNMARVWYLSCLMFSL